jgi:ATP-dependent Clp protease protease subunit
MNSDFKKFINSQGITSTFYGDYFKKIQKVNSTANLLESNGMPVDIFSKLLDERIIFLTDEIDSEICNIIKAQLLYLDMENDEDISIYIDSPGGSVYSGMGLLDVMDYISSDISTVNIGLAASMAAVVLCSGKKNKRKALRRSRTMIHQPLTYGGWMQQASDVEIEAREMNLLKKELYEIISERTGQTYDRVYKDGDRDYWMSSTDAKKYGMIDEIILKKK